MEVENVAARIEVAIARVTGVVAHAPRFTLLHPPFLNFRRFIVMNLDLPRERHLITEIPPSYTPSSSAKPEMSKRSLTAAPRASLYRHLPASETSPRQVT